VFLERFAVINRPSQVALESLTPSDTLSQESSFFYQCGCCFLTLITNKALVPRERIELIRAKDCPGCGVALSETLICREAKTLTESASWIHPAIGLDSRKANGPRADFRSAASLYGLSSSVRFIDNLIGGLKHDSIVFLKGSRTATLLAERYCLRAQLPEGLGGLAGCAYFLDGGNSFDVYHFTSIAKEHRLDLDSALNRLVITRAFTAYELLQLVSKDATDVFDAYNPRLLVVSDAFGLLTQDIDADEGIRIMRGVGRAVRKISEERQVPILVTASSGAGQLGFFFQDYCDTVLELNEHYDKVEMNLLKHPSRHRITGVQELTHSHNQDVLVSARLITNG
jgi:Rad51